MDEMLLQLRTEAQVSPRAICHDQEYFRLARDFAVHRQRIAILEDELTHVKPR